MSTGNWVERWQRKAEGDMWEKRPSSSEQPRIEDELLRYSGQGMERPSESVQPSKSEQTGVYQQEDIDAAVKRADELHAGLNIEGCKEKDGQCRCGRFPRPHDRQRLCGIGFNEFLGEVQHRLIQLGYEPPLWPDPTISDQGDVDEALNVCTRWCAERLNEIAALRSATPAMSPLLRVLEAAREYTKTRYYQNVEACQNDQDRREDVLVLAIHDADIALRRADKTASDKGQG